tara:strand:- start:145 stop:582 length:438 start_codon:yes stop_codon:yes gene_type:complete
MSATSHPNESSKSTLIKTIQTIDKDGRPPMETHTIRMMEAMFEEMLKIADKHPSKMSEILIILSDSYSNLQNINNTLPSNKPTYTRDCRHGINCRIYECKFYHPEGKNPDCIHGKYCKKFATDERHRKLFNHHPSMFKCLPVPKK